PILAKGSLNGIDEFPLSEFWGPSVKSLADFLHFHGIWARKRDDGLLRGLGDRDNATVGSLDKFHLGGVQSQHLRHLVNFPHRPRTAAEGSQIRPSHYIALRRNKGQKLSMSAAGKKEAGPDKASQSDDYKGQARSGQAKD